MPTLLKEYLRDDYTDVIKAWMIKNYHNNTSLARRTGYSKMHIGHVLNGLGSDTAIREICKVMLLPMSNIVKDEYKELFDDEDDQGKTSRAAN